MLFLAVFSHQRSCAPSNQVFKRASHLSIFVSCAISLPNSLVKCYPVGFYKQEIYIEEISSKEVPESKQASGARCLSVSSSVARIFYFDKALQLHMSVVVATSPPQACCPQRRRRQTAQGKPAGEDATLALFFHPTSASTNPTARQAPRQMRRPAKMPFM